MARGHERFVRIALLLIGAAALAALWLGAARPQQAHAAPCPSPTYGMDAGGNLSIQGTAPCADAPEVIAPYCSGGTVWFAYSVNGASVGPYDTGVACGASRHLKVYGNGGDDTLNLSRVSAANGFTGINQPNLIGGGYGNDMLIAGPDPALVRGGQGNNIILVRNGVSDVVDCSGGFGAVQTDRPGIDSVIGCAIIDFAPLTGQRDAQLKRCKHKHGKAKKKCRKKANLLPV